MLIRSFSIVILLNLLLVLPGCVSSAEAIDSIMLQRTRCFGVCPVYTVSIDAAGQVSFRGEQFVASTGEFSAVVDAARFERLAEFARRIDFFNLDDEYRYGTGSDGSRIAVSDLPSRITTVTLGNQSKTVLNYFSGPDELAAFEDLIDELTGSARWIEQ